MVKNEKVQTYLVSEYGYGIKEPPHTYRAFLAAGNRPYLGIKCALRFTKDHQPLSASKPFLQTAQKYYFRNLTLTEFKDLGVLAFPNEVTCELHDFLLLCKRYEKRPFIELNRDITEQEIDYLLTLFLQFSIKVKILSPKLETLSYIRQKDLHIELQYIVGRYSDDALLLCCKYHFDLYIKTAGLSDYVHADIVGLCHDYNIKVACGPTNKKTDAKAYSARGVDYLYTEGVL